MIALLGVLPASGPALPIRVVVQQETPPAIQDVGDAYILNFSEDPADLLNLLDFVKLAQEATGLNFTYDQQTGEQLKSAKAVMLGAKTIPKGLFYDYFQVQLFINEFVCVEIGPPEIRLVLIQSLQQGTRGQQTIKQKTTYVLPQDLDDYRDRPAVLITTVLNFRNIDARQLQTNLRALVIDSNTQTMVPAGERALILQGFGSYIASLARLLLLVDEYSAAGQLSQPVFDLIPLEFAAAEDVADLLEQLLEAQQEQATRRPGRQQQQVVEGEVVGGFAPGVQLESKILVDGRTNSLLVMALPEEMPRIKDLVARLDVDVIEPERNFHVYSLQNVKAKDLADVLDEFLSGAERLTGEATGGTGGRAAQSGDGGRGRSGATARTSSEVIVVADEPTNALLIAANKSRYGEVLELIRQLDRRQDQVLIESALIELTGSDFRDIGVEWALADTAEDGGFGVTGFGLSTLDDSDGDGAPDTRLPLSPTSGLVAGILSGDDVNLPLLLSAASRTTGANVLNVPSVLVSNNGQAKVVTLDQQPTTTVTVTGQAAGGTQESFAGYQDAGITLEISPSISASRYLRLEISLIVSNFTGSFTGGPIPPPRITREMKTTVNVPDGDTMVIGGVIADTEQQTRTGVPWLSDLPLVGALFRRDADTDARTTLYFFVTPHILRDPDFADLSEISYQKKLSAAEIMGKDRVRLIDPDFGSSESAIDFGSFQVPLYRPSERGEVAPEDVGLEPRSDPRLRTELTPGAPETPPVSPPTVPDDPRR